MGKLIYSYLASLDGYIADETGNFDWAEPSAEVHAFINDLQRTVQTELLGRRMYETMAPWETMHTMPEQTPETLDFARIWQAMDKVVYSRTLAGISTARTRLERDFLPTAVRELKEASAADLSISGATLAAEAFRAGLVDELQLFVTPIIVGGGTPWLPAQLRLPLELAEERRFANGMVYLRYTAKP